MKIKSTVYKFNSTFSDKVKIINLARNALKLTYDNFGSQKKFLTLNGGLIAFTSSNH